MQSPFELIKKSLLVVLFWWVVLALIRMRKVGINHEGFLLNVDSILLLFFTFISLMTVYFFLFLFDSEKIRALQRRISPVEIDGLTVNLGNHFTKNAHPKKVGTVKSHLTLFRTLGSQKDKNTLSISKLLKHESIFEGLFNALEDQDRQQINDYLKQLIEHIESFKYTGISTLRPVTGKGKAINLKNNPLVILTALFPFYSWSELRNSKHINSLNLHEKRVLFQARGLYDIYYKNSYNQTEVPYIAPTESYRYPQMPIHIQNGKPSPILDEPVALIELERFIKGFKPLAITTLDVKEEAYSIEMLFGLLVELISENDRINGKVTDKRIGMFAEGDLYLYNEKLFKELRKLFRLTYPQFGNKVGSIPMAIYGYLHDQGYLNVVMEGNDGEDITYTNGELLSVEWVSSENDKPIITNGILRIKAIGSLSHIRSIVKKASNYPRIRGIDEQDAIEGSLRYETLFGQTGKLDDASPDNSILSKLEQQAKNDIAIGNSALNMEEPDLAENQHEDIISELENELENPVPHESSIMETTSIDIDAELMPVDDQFQQIDFLGSDFGSVSSEAISGTDSSEVTQPEGTLEGVITDFLNKLTESSQDQTSIAPESPLDGIPQDQQNPMAAAKDGETTTVPATKPKRARKKPESNEETKTSRLAPSPKISNAALKSRINEHMVMLRSDFFNGTRLDHVKQEDMGWTIFNTHLHEFFDQTLIGGLTKFHKEADLYEVSFNYIKPDDQATKRVKQVKLVRIYKSGENKLYKNISADEWTKTNIRALMVKMFRQLEGMKRQDKVRLGINAKLLPANALYHTIYSFPKENLGTIFGEHATVIQNLLNCITQHPNDPLFKETKEELFVSARSNDGTETFVELKLLKNG